MIEISRHVFGLDNCSGIVCNQGLYIAYFCRASADEALRIFNEAVIP